MGGSKSKIDLSLIENKKQKNGLWNAGEGQISGNREQNAHEIQILNTDAQDRALKAEAYWRNAEPEDQKSHPSWPKNFFPPQIQ